jgi:cytochrome c oxidase assembly factor CtaG
MLLATWLWHWPVAFELALRSPGWHVVEHASFFAAGLAFWWPVVEPWPSRSRWPRWAMIPCLLLADLQNTALAALLVFSDRVLYPSYARFDSPLEDQAAAGVLMWVPMSLAYLVPAAVLAARLLAPRAVAAHASVHASRSPVAVTGRAP